MGKPKLDYATIYTLLQTHTAEEVSESLGIHLKSVQTIKNIGDELLADKPKPKDARTLNQFTPRELMSELFRRGYKGKLQYVQEIDISNF